MPTRSSKTETPDDAASLPELAAQVQHLSHLAQALTGEKEFLRAVLDSGEDALVAFDRHGQFSLCNRRFGVLFDVRGDDLAGHDEMWLREKLRPFIETSETFWKAPEKSGVQQETVRLLASDSRSQSARERVLQWHSAPVRGERGKLGGRVVAVRDITREAEVDEMKTDFISIVSHELRTPMTSIRGYVDLILDGDAGELNDLQRAFLKTVQRNTMRLVALVNDMLDMSRIEDGDTDFQLRPVMLGDVISHVIGEARPQIDAKNLTLAVECHNENGTAIAPPRVLADFDRMVQVLGNLLANAVKYTQSPPASAGQILLDITVDSTQQRARLCVSDTGIGISPEDMARLFQKFFRAGDPLTREVEGSGLGLSITEALVEKMGGTLEVQSRVGQGSEFWFSLALAPAERVKGSQPLVLIVSASPVLTDAARAALGERESMVAYSGAAAVRHVSEEKVLGIALDLLMPHGDSFRFVRFLEENLQSGHLPMTLLNLPGPARPHCREIAPDELAPRGSVLRVGEGSPALDAALDACAASGATVLTMATPAQALAALLDPSEGNAISGLVLDTAMHDEQAIELIDALGANAGAQAPWICLACGTHLFLCSWIHDTDGISALQNWNASL